MKSGDVVYAIQFILGSMVFFTFFAAMFNGLDRLVLLTALVGLTINMAVSALAARKSARSGINAAIAFGGPAILFSIFSIGDALAYGKIQPFLFWFGSAVAAVSSGLLGVAVVNMSGVRGKSLTK